MANNLNLTISFGFELNSNLKQNILPHVLFVKLINIQQLAKVSETVFFYLVVKVKTIR